MPLKKDLGQRLLRSFATSTKRSTSLARVKPKTVNSGPFVANSSNTRLLKVVHLRTQLLQSGMAVEREVPASRGITKAQVENGERACRRDPPASNLHEASVESLQTAQEKRPRSI